MFSKTENTTLKSLLPYTLQFTEFLTMLVSLTPQGTLPGILGLGLLGKTNPKITWEKNYLKGLLSLQKIDLKVRNATEKLPPERDPPWANQIPQIFHDNK